LRFVKIKKQAQGLMITRQVRYDVQVGRS